MDEPSLHEHGPPCKHALALFEVMRVGKLKVASGDYAASEATVKCNTCLTWHVEIPAWHGLEVDIPDDLCD